MAIKQNFTELDFDKIKSSLRSYLENQEQFKDYNFEGSNLSVLLDILAYNDQYMSFYANMMFPERFLRHAILRKHVVSLAQNLGYTPRSRRSSTATVELELIASSGHTGSLVIPKNTKFSGVNNEGESFIFQTTEEVVVPEVSGEYKATIEIYEGKFYTFNKTIGVGEKGVVIPNPGVDTSRLDVYVRASEGAATRTQYQRSNDYAQVEANDTVFFLEEEELELFRVYFGDDIAGKAIQAGNVVEIEYYISSGQAPNQIAQFSLDDAIANTDAVNVTTISASSGGREIESIESIRLLSPLFYQAQNRAVTSEDYRALILQNFPNVDDAIAWGGEELSPPDFGSVYVSLKPLSGQTLSQTDKDDIKSFMLDNYAVVSIEIKTVDPEYIRCSVSSEVYYDSFISNPGVVQIHSDVSTAIQQFNDDNLEMYDKVLRYSRLVRAIDDSSASIINSNTVVRMGIQAGDAANINQNTLSLRNEITPGTVETSIFEYDTYPEVIIKDQAGDLRLYEIVDGAEEDLNTIVGYINYATGDVTFDLGAFDTSLMVTEFSINAETDTFDINVERNQIIQIDDADITVNITDIRTGTTYGGE